MFLYSEIKKDAHKVTFVVNPELSKYFIDNFWYESEQLPEKLPEAIAVIPLLANVAPVIWLFGLNVTIKECDEVFFNALAKWKSVLKSLWPNKEWAGEINCEKLINFRNLEATNEVDNPKSVMLFSGGLDSVTTLMRHKDENPTLLCIRGADCDLEDLDRWATFVENTNQVATSLNCLSTFVSSNFRVFLNRELLDHYVKQMGGKDWWLSIQHGWGLLSFLVPISETSAMVKGYIASSNHLEDLYASGSRPDSDEAFESSLFGGGHITIAHDGVELHRFEKLDYLYQLMQQKLEIPPVRVCLRSFSGGNNCCTCEKCARTIASILAIGCSQPDMFGFDEYTKFGENWNQIFIRNVMKGRHSMRADWVALQKIIRERDWYLEHGLKEYQIEFLEWVKNLDIDQINKRKAERSKHRTPEWLKRLTPSSKVLVPAKLRLLWNRIKDSYF